ncbi:MAG: hypothetical protein ACLRWM_01605 [Streptococcus sp.]
MNREDRRRGSVRHESSPGESRKLVINFLAGMPAEEWEPKIGDEVTIKVKRIQGKKDFFKMSPQYQDFINSLEDGKPYKITSTGMKGQVYGIDAHPYFRFGRVIWNPTRSPNEADVLQDGLQRYASSIWCIAYERPLV